MRLSFALSDSGVAAKLQRLASPTPLTAAMALIAGDMETQTVLRFDAETAPDGKGWQPSQRARKQGGKTLTDTARLRQSLTSRAGDDYAEVGTNMIYARIHQLGGSAGRGGAATIPARPYLGFGEADKANIKQIIVQALGAA